MAEQQSNQRPYRGNNRDNRRPPRGGHQGPPRGGFQGPPREGFQGPPRGGYQGPPRGEYQGPPRGKFRGHRGGHYGVPARPPFQPTGHPDSGPFQGPMSNAPVDGGFLPTPNQGEKQTVREETTTTTYIGGNKVTKTVVTIKEGGSTVEQPPSSPGFPGSGYPPPPPPPPHTNPNMYGASGYDTRYPPTPPMHGAPAHGHMHMTNQRPPQPPPPNSGMQEQRGGFNQHRPPPSYDGQNRGRGNRDRNNTRGNRGGNIDRRSGSKDRRYQNKAMGRSVSLMDIAIDDDVVKKYKNDKSSESDQDSDNSTSQPMLKSKQEKDKNRNKKKKRSRQDQVDNDVMKEKPIFQDNPEGKDEDKTRKSSSHPNGIEGKSKKKTAYSRAERTFVENATDEVNDKPTRKKSGKQKPDHKQTEERECAQHENDDNTDNETNADKNQTKSKKHGKPKREKKTDSKEDIQNHAKRDIQQERKTSESSDSSKQQYGPNVKDVFDFMVKEMNGKGKPKDIQKKSGLFPENFNKSMVEEWFKRFSKRFKSIIRQDRVVLVIVYNREMNYCLDYISRQSCNKDNCGRYHVCKDMLCGFCKFGSSCKKSHDFLDTGNENTNITRRLRLAGYTNDQLLVMMMCRYPHVCHNWNKPKGCKNNLCEKLHICENFLLNKCENGDECSFGHERASSHNTPIIEAYEMSSWNDVNFRRIIYIQRRDDDEDAGEDDTKEDTSKTVRGKLDIVKSDQEMFLCDQHLLGNCHKAKCPLYHNDDLQLPYIWQIKHGDKWTSLSQSEEIEKEYCALVEHSEPTYMNNFDSGESELIKIDFIPRIRAEILTSDVVTEARRLSTRSYKEKGPVSNFRTQWRWYKRSAGGEFQQYSSDKLQHTLEEKFLSGQKEYQFLTETLPYIDFTAMVECDEGSYTPVLRRPLLVTGTDVEEKKTPVSLPTPVNIPILVPKGWTKWDCSEKAELVKLPETSQEYKMVYDQFYSSFKESQRSQWPIKHIFRVQNYTLWDQFCSKERSMKTALQQAGREISSLDKRHLFHGTDNFNAVKGICRENIDPRVSGKNATNYGDGAYFARQAFLAHMYTKSPDRFVFMVNVLVGNYTKGNEEYRKPPKKPDTDGEYFDSCVDDISKPMKFVIFDRTQYYPEFLIWYGDESD